MRPTVIVASFVAPVFGALLLAAPQYQTPIGQQLQAVYQITRVGTNGVVLQAGSILVIQQDSIKANLAVYQSYYHNSFKKGGRIGQSAINNFIHIPDKSAFRFLQVGERVYVTNIEIKPADIIFSLQSCGTCNPSAVDPNDVPYRAELSFPFPRGFVAPANFKEIQDTIGKVFAVASPTENPTTTAAPTPATSEPKAAISEAPLQPIQPPPPPADQPPPPPKTISKGDTKDQVVEVFGQPERMVKLDAKEIYYYKDLKVTFVNGKVEDVQ